MKIRVLITALFALIAISAFSQQRAVDDAKDNYTKYDGLRSNAALAKPMLMNAKTSIDKAAANKKTEASPEMFALKAAIYASLAAVDTDPAAVTTDYATAQEALDKAKTADTKNENTNMIKHAAVELAQIQLNKGVKSFQDKKFDEAYTFFQAAEKFIPGDTTAILYAGISASNAKNYPAAIESYKQLINSNYRKKTQSYNDLTTLYLFSKDTTNALKTIGEAVAKYPTNTELRKREIEVSLQAGQSADLISKIDAAVKADPNNKTLYYYEGLTYSQIAETEGAEIKKLQKADTKAAAAKPGSKPAPNPQIAKLQQMRIDNYNKAAAQYQKALAIDPNYFEAVLNMGYVTIAPAIDIYNNAQQIPVNQGKAYKDAMDKATAGFDAAKPYVMKAVELNPQSLDALTNLKSYYLGKKDTENANAVQKKIDALPKSGQ